MPPSPRILIADPAPIVRAGLQAAVEDAGMHVVAVCEDADDAVAQVADHRPDAVLLSADLPGGAEEAMRRIAEDVAPRPEFVVVAEHADPALMLRMVRAGAHGFLPAESDPARLPYAIAGVLAGETAFPRRLVRAMADELAREERRRLRRTAGDVLTTREADVLEALAAGHGAGDVARALQITDATLRRHVANAMKKLGAADRSEAIAALRDRHG